MDAGLERGLPEMNHRHALGVELRIQRSDDLARVGTGGIMKAEGHIDAVLVEVLLLVGLEVDLKCSVRDLAAAERWPGFPKWSRSGSGRRR